MVDARRPRRENVAIRPAALRPEVVKEPGRWRRPEDSLIRGSGAPEGHLAKLKSGARQAPRTAITFPNSPFLFLRLSRAKAVDRAIQPCNIRQTDCSVGGPFWGTPSQSVTAVRGGAAHCSRNVPVRAFRSLVEQRYFGPSTNGTACLGLFSSDRLGPVIRGPPA